MSDTKDPRTHAIIGAAMEVHRLMGCGLSEQFYQDALEVEFNLRGIPFSREPAYHVFYKDTKLASYCRPDFIGYSDIVIELKALTEITGKEEAQVLGYLKATGFQTGLLLNFGAPSLYHRRFVHASKWTPQAVLLPSDKSA